jgi:hypothetical protein
VCKPSDCFPFSSFQDFIKCSKIKFKPDDASCQESSIDSWPDMQRCLNYPLVERVPFATKEIVIQLIGERTTGSKFVVEELKRCFPSNEFGLKIHRDYLRPKHWFQKVEHNISAVPLNRIVVATFPDPFEWMAAMIENPYHCTNHLKGFDKDFKPIPLDWEDFVHRPWSMPNRTQRDLRAFSAGGVVHCTMYHFKYHQVIPCLLEKSKLPPATEKAYLPLYKLRQNGPFDNILQMQSDKIDSLLEVPLLHSLGG